MSMQTWQDSGAMGANGVQKAEVKSPTAFRTISEVAADLDVPQHVLRFWESKFSQIRPMKRGGGRRYYRPDDVNLLKYIQNLLYGQGYTIRGVQKVLRETRGGVIQRISTQAGMQQQPAVQEKIGSLGIPGPAAVKGKKSASLAPQQRKEIEGVLAELQSLRDLLRKSGF